MNDDRLHAAITDVARRLTDGAAPGSLPANVMIRLTPHRRAIAWPWAAAAAMAAILLLLVTHRTVTEVSPVIHTDATPSLAKSTVVPATVAHGDSAPHVVAHPSTRRVGTLQATVRPPAFEPIAGIPPISAPSPIELADIQPQPLDIRPLVTEPLVIEPLDASEQE